VPTTSTSTSTTSTTTPPAGDQCARLAALRARTNAEITAIQQALSQSLTGAELQARIAQLEQLRAAANAQIDRARAMAGCPPLVT
jgi:hypothetical protein